ncbi:HIT family protein [Psychrobacillus psychrodurans]|uniref:HIT family protein n=1 Tax=Psychrobacillus psychrodurans TaxID=126157 RepID=A0A9X3L8R5_9BACI|nr:HIT family protein [Psychrobacillus psychrodurans]MCK1998204.1 HIT family protein [Psychrobacillus psychrodurans]MCZ8533482.1 HIT family protein [Psychrobacillus psychrodurans]MCZ8542199.1 HIT family protein [Psychrobacillus psychrodurans]SFN19093.1 histidine triad (HIT) family protein [Psychrobacillus psychrodurans]
MSECIFCKIIDGSIPSAKIYEDDHVYAFMDIMPLTKGHTLIIPKNHKENIYDLSEEEASNLFKVVPKIASVLKESFGPVGMNLLNNNGAPAGQSVFHFHLHFIPRYDQTDGFRPTWITKEKTFTPEIIQNLAAELYEKLKK